MIFPRPYHRARLEHEGPEPRAFGPAAALACHKGDASQSQTSEQLGAQTGGIVLSNVTIDQRQSVNGGGGNGRGYSGPGFGPDWQPASSSPGPTTGTTAGGPAIQITSDPNAPAAIAALNDALNNQGAVNQQLALAVAQNAVNGTQPAATTPPAPSLGNVAAIVSIVGGLILAAHYFKTKKTT